LKEEYKKIESNGKPGVYTLDNQTVYKSPKNKIHFIRSKRDPGVKPFQLFESGTRVVNIINNKYGTIDKFKEYQMSIPIYSVIYYDGKYESNESETNLYAEN
jgi:hypothetical protein